jgi:hypothetical protein
MKSLRAMLFTLFVLLSRQSVAQQATAVQNNSSGEAASQEETPTQQRIAAAKQQIAADPKRVQAHNELALAYILRARETADLTYLEDADAALTQGLKQEPESFSAAEDSSSPHVEPP